MGKQSREKKIPTANAAVYKMKRSELLEVLLSNEHLDILLRNISIKEKFKKIEYLYNEFKLAISTLCEIASVSRSGFYKWIKNGRKLLNKWNEKLAFLIESVYLKFNKAYGYKMLTLLIKKFTIWN